MTMDRQDHLTSSTIDALRKEPTVLSVAPAMGVMFVEPDDSGAARSAPLIWGVKVLRADSLMGKPQRQRDESARWKA